MYRARAEAIDGMKVFAGGKWLRCIGNKKVRVGELIWTDGRCVYGNNRISQQPLVITAGLVKKGIPILAGNQYFSFIDDKLKVLTATSAADKLFISNDSGRVCLLNGSYRLYSGIGSIIAANLDNNGNLYTLFSVGDGTVRVYENDRISSEIDLNSLRDKMADDCPDAPDYWLEIAPNRQNFDFEFIDAFIDNAENWAFRVSCYVEKFAPYPDFVPQGMSRIGYETAVFGYELSRDYFINSNNSEKILQNILRTERRDSSGWGLNDEYQITQPQISDALFPLQDNHFFSIEYFSYTINSEERPVPVTLWQGEIRTFFTPNGQKIFSGLFADFAHTVLKKINSGYLLGVASTNNSVARDYYDPLYRLPNCDLTGFGNGIFLLNNNQTTVLSNSICRNQQFRLTKKIDDWQNRIH